VTAGEAVLAASASDSRLHRHPASGSERHAGSGGNDLAGRLMPQHLRIDGLMSAYATLQVPMHIAAADANRADTNQDLARTGVGRHRQIANFHRAGRDQLNGFHGRATIIHKETEQEVWKAADWHGRGPAERPGTDGGGYTLPSFA